MIKTKKKPGPSRRAEDKGKETSNERKEKEKKREGGKEETVRELEVPVWVLSGVKIMMEV